MEYLQGSYCLKNYFLNFLFTHLIFLHNYFIKVPSTHGLLNDKVILLILVDLDDLHKVRMPQFLQNRELVLEQVHFLGIKAAFPYDSNTVLILIPVSIALPFLAHGCELDDLTKRVMIIKEASILVNEILTIPKQLFSDHLHLANSIGILISLPLASSAAAHYNSFIILKTPIQ